MVSNGISFPIRSWLCASSLKSNLVSKATEAGADIAHFDLEDSVPVAQKSAAREAIKHHFESHPAIPTALRINSLGSVNGVQDLLFVVEHRLAIDIVILPKACVRRDVGIANAILRETRHPAKLFAVIETVDSLCELRDLPTCPPGLTGIIFGAADFATDLGVALDQADLGFVRREIALLAKRFGLIAIDSPCFNLDDDSFVRKEAEDVRRLGYVGKIAIHPAQVAIINEEFTPSTAHVAHARRVVNAFDEGGGSSILRDRDGMVGPPFLLHARTVIERALALEATSTVRREET